MLSLPVVGRIVQHPQTLSFSVPWVAVLPDQSGCFAGCGVCGALWSRLNPRIRLATKAQGYRQTGENHWNLPVLPVLEYNKKNKIQNAALNYLVLSQDPKITTFQLVK